MSVRLYWCVDCNTWRTSLYCEVCHARELYEKCRDKTDALIRRLDAKTRVVFASDLVDAYADDKPAPRYPNTQGKTDREAAQLIAAYHVACERWEIEHYTRLYNATKQKAYRARKKLNEDEDSETTA